MKQLRIFSILMALLIMASCNKSEDQATGVGDALIVAKQSGGNTVYGLSIYAYTYSSFASITAVGSADPGKTYTLKSNQGFKTSFSYETPDSEYTTTKPAAATYNFAATFENGVNQTFQNVLTDKVLPVPTFEKCEYNDVEHQLEMNWPLISGATSYAVNILNGSKIVFASVELRNITKGAFAKTTSGGGWDVGFTPKAGETYTVRLFAYMYEPGGGAYTIQSVSMADKSVVWGN